jgi:hypothetical protein
MHDWSRQLPATRPNQTLAPLIHRKPLSMYLEKQCYESLSALRLGGGHGFPSFNAACFASRMATICFACERVSSRRLARPPRRPIFARYSRTRFSAPVIECSTMHRKRLMMQGKTEFRSASVRLPAVILRPLGSALFAAACRGNDAVHAQILDHLPVVS